MLIDINNNALSDMKTQLLFFKKYNIINIIINLIVVFKRIFREKVKTF